MHLNLRHTLAGSLLVGLVFSAALAQPSATSRTAPRIVSPPKGFVKETISGVPLFIEATEAEWIREAAKGFKPATRPAMGPAEIVEGIGKDRTRLVGQIKADLALADDKEINKFLDEKFLPALRKVESGQPVFYYLPITEQKLKDIVAGGWGDPQFYYNRHSQQVQYDPSYQWPRGEMADESVVPILYGMGELQATRVKALTDTLVAREAGRVGRVVLEGQLRAVQMFQELIEETAMAPLKLRRDQQWFSLGIQAFLTSKYAAPYANTERTRLLDQFANPGQNPISPWPIDLIDPMEESILRADFRPLYRGAMQNKATVVVNAWTKAKGEEVIPKTLAAVAKAKPADGKALLKLIQDETGLDLTPDLKPR
jgi:hypothetical protein